MNEKRGTIDYINQQIYSNDYQNLPNIKGALGG